ncbi:CHRD domain-containing protein [Pedobacter zeae]|nr:CHRD domain-containing protein [Pedobacter zeae]
MNLITLKRYCLMPALAMLFFSGCKKDTYTSDVFVKKQWKVDLSASKVLPAISGRTDHAVAMVYLMDNMEVHYDIYFDKALENNDTPGNAKIYLGAETTSGAVFIDLKTPAFNAERETKGSVPVDAATATKLQSEKIYLQISSVQQPNGLVRGQLN